MDKVYLDKVELKDTEVAFDVETTITIQNQATAYERAVAMRRDLDRISNPFYGNHHIVSNAYSRGEQEVVGQYFGKTPPPEHEDEDLQYWFHDMLEGAEVLIGANIKFDLLQALAESEDNFYDFQEFILRGGMIWDISSAEYLLGGMVDEVHYPRLDDMAPRYGGEIKPDAVAMAWDEGIQTYDIPKEVLMEYNKGDVDNTRMVYAGQYHRMDKEGMLELMYVEMMGLLGIIMMEYWGMYVDYDRGMAKAGELAKKSEEAIESMDKVLPKDLPFDFRWTRNQMSALLYGGKVRYDGTEISTDKDGNVIYPNESIRINRRDKDTGEVLRFQSGKSEGEPRGANIVVPNYWNPNTRKGDQYYEFPQLVEPKPEWATKTGYSLKEEILEEIIVTHPHIPVVKEYGAYMSLEKDLGTYYYKRREGNVPTGMLDLVGEDGILRPSYNNVATYTARYSSSKPNAQNFPNPPNSEVKFLFVSRYGEEGYIVQSDFSNLEVYCQAVLTGDKALVQDLRNGVDMHCKRVSQIHDISYEEAYEKCRVERDPYWVGEREKAKIFSFQKMYGAGKYTIMLQTGLSEEAMDTLYAEELRNYPMLDVFTDKVYAEVMSNISAPFRIDTHELLPKGVLKRHLPKGTDYWAPDSVEFPEVWLGTGYYRTPDNKLYGFKQYPSLQYQLDEGQLLTVSIPATKNYPIQGLGAQIQKCAIGLITYELMRRDWFDWNVHFVNSVHDDNKLDVHEDYLLEAGALLHACMESASDFYSELMYWEFPLQMPAETAYGEHMADENEFDSHEDKEEFWDLVEKYKEEMHLPFIKENFGYIQ